MSRYILLFIILCVIVAAFLLNAHKFHVNGGDEDLELEALYHMEAEENILPYIPSKELFHEGKKVSMWDIFKNYNLTNELDLLKDFEENRELLENHAKELEQNNTQISWYPEIYSDYFHINNLHYLLKYSKNLINGFIVPYEIRSELKDDTKYYGPKPRPVARMIVYKYLEKVIKENNIKKFKLPKKYFNLECCITGQRDHKVASEKYVDNYCTLRLVKHGGPQQPKIGLRIRFPDILTNQNESGTLFTNRLFNIYAQRIGYKHPNYETKLDLNEPKKPPFEMDVQAKKELETICNNMQLDIEGNGIWKINEDYYIIDTEIRRHTKEDCRDKIEKQYFPEKK